MKLDPTAFREAAHQALDDTRLKVALGRLKTHFVHKRADSIARFGDFEALRETGRAIRDWRCPISTHCWRHSNTTSRSAAGMCIGRVMPGRRARLF